MDRHTVRWAHAMVSRGRGRPPWRVSHGPRCRTKRTPPIRCHTLTRPLNAYQLWLAGPAKRFRAQDEDRSQGPLKRLREARCCVEVLAAFTAPGGDGSRVASVSDMSAQCLALGRFGVQASVRAFTRAGTISLRFWYVE